MGITREEAWAQLCEWTESDALRTHARTVEIVMRAAAHRYGAGAANIAGEFSGSLANSGEMIELRGKFGELIQSFSYDDRWYPSTDGDGVTLVIIDDAAPVADWDRDVLVQEQLLDHSFRTAIGSGAEVRLVVVTPNDTAAPTAGAQGNSAYDLDADYERTEIVDNQHLP